jgi:hypothetical protein
MLLDDQRGLRDRLEEVSIETVHVGDYLVFPLATRVQPRALCVLSKLLTRLRPTDKIAGWRLELSDRGAIWMPRKTRVTRHRFEHQSR